MRETSAGGPGPGGAPGDGRVPCRARAPRAPATSSLSSRRRMCRGSPSRSATLSRAAGWRSSSGTGAGRPRRARCRPSTVCSSSTGSRVSRSSPSRGRAARRNRCSSASRSSAPSAPRSATPSCPIPGGASPASSGSRAPPRSSCSTAPGGSSSISRVSGPRTSRCSRSGSRRASASRRPRRRARRRSPRRAAGPARAAAPSPPREKPPAEDPTRALLEKYRYFGNFHLNRGEPAKAEEYFRKIVELAPNDTSAWLHIGESCARQRRYDQAREAWEQVLRIEPGNRGGRRQHPPADPRRILIRPGVRCGIPAGGRRRAARPGRPRKSR